MTPIREQVDTMIRRLKAQDSMEGVRFIRAYSDEGIETPIQGFSAVVGVIKAEQKQGFTGGLAAPGVRGSLYSAEVELRVFAPYRQSGEGLSELVSAITPVPGGVGSVTTAILAKHVVEAAERTLA